MTYFAGLDVGLEETAICIIDSNGGIVRELRACSEPEALVRALRALDVRYGRVGLEACPLSSWLFEGLAAAGLPVVCLEVRHLRAVLAAMTHKTDRNDARGIAQVLRTGWFKAVHVKTAWSQERRTLLTARKRMLEQAFDVENTIRGLLKGHGLKVGRVTRTTFAPRVRELVAVVPVLAAAIEPLLTAHATLRKSFTELHRQVLAVTRIDPVSRRLMTVPGIGAVTALAYCSAVDIPERFPRSRAVGAHFGLVPRKYQSGTTDRNGRITKAGDAMVRTALYEAANVLLTRVTRWSPLKAWAVQARSADRWQAREGGARPQARRDPAPDLDRRHNLHLGEGASDGCRLTSSSERHPLLRGRPCRDARTGEAAAGCGAQPRSSDRLAAPFRCDHVAAATDHGRKHETGRETKNEELDSPTPITERPASVVSL
jgi:transposase